MSELLSGNEVWWTYIRTNVQTDGRCNYFGSIQRDIPTEGNTWLKINMLNVYKLEFNGFYGPSIR